MAPLQMYSNASGPTRCIDLLPLPASLLTLDSVVYPGRSPATIMQRASRLAWRLVPCHGVCTLPCILIDEMGRVSLPRLAVVRPRRADSLGSAGAVRGRGGQHAQSRRWRLREGMLDTRITPCWPLHDAPTACPSCVGDPSCRPANHSPDTQSKARNKTCCVGRVGIEAASRVQLERVQCKAEPLGNTCLPFTFDLFSNCLTTSIHCSQSKRQEIQSQHPACLPTTTSSFHQARGLRYLAGAVPSRGLATPKCLTAHP